MREMIKQFLYAWVLPPGVLYILKWWIWNGIKRRHFATLNTYCKSSRKLFILATGPSLSVDRVKYKLEIQHNDTLVMNQFAESDVFVEIKPKIYLLVDSLYFSDLSRLQPVVRGKMVRLREALINKVDWSMSLIVPDVAKGSDLLRVLKGNPSIKVLYYNSRLPFTYNRFGLFLLLNGLVAPPAQTVACVAACLGVLLKYGEIWMLGIDTSMHTMMRVDQKTNEMYIENSHFYGKQREPIFNAGKPAKASYWLDCASKMLAGYEIVRKFADYSGVRVINASSFSWVDSLERVEQ